MGIHYEGVVSCSLCQQRFYIQKNTHCYDGIICDDCIADILPTVDGIYKFYKERNIQLNRWERRKLDTLQRLAYGRLESDRNLVGKQVAASLRRKHLLNF